MMAERDELFEAPDGRPRCFWCAGHSDLLDYHDAEWGMPVADDRRLFEKLCLEGFQSGLSWLTVLRKRPRFREVFADFEPAAVARFGAKDVARLLEDPGIIRHRGKIEATIANARAAVKVQDELGSIGALVWPFEPAAKTRPAKITRAALGGLSKTDASLALSKELKRRGFVFVGPTTAYAFMQAMGLVNDHQHACVVRAPVEKARAAFVRPGSA